jgi:hypothetical protein
VRGALRNIQSHRQIYTPTHEGEVEVVHHLVGELIFQKRSNVNPQFRLVQHEVRNDQCFFTIHIIAIEQYEWFLSSGSVVLTDDRHWGAKDGFGKDMWASRVAPEVNQILRLVISTKSQLSHDNL